MLGFAAVDLSEADHRLTVWLTSLVTKGAIPYVDHTNAVSFDLREDLVLRRAWSMSCDRYVVVTSRTPLDHPAFSGWGLKPCDLSGLLDQTAAAQEMILAALAEHKKEPGKKNLAEPSLPPVPKPLDPGSLYVDDFRKPPLVLADYVKTAWAVWIATDRERIKRRAYMPEGRDNANLVILPPEFGEARAGCGR